MIPSGLLIALLVAAAVDANAAAPNGRYTLTTDTVYDAVTNRTWQRSFAAPPLNGNTGYTQSAAINYCQTLSLSGIGPGGWRLPRKLELESIVDYRSASPSIDLTAFPGTPGSGSQSVFWSSTLDAANGGLAWVVAFDVTTPPNSGSYIDGPDVSYSVRCVH